MKAGWEVKALGEVAEIKPPKSQVKQAISDGDEVSFVPMSDLGELQKLFQPKNSRALSEVYGAYTYFGENDVLVAKITPCFENGKLGIARGLTNKVGFGSSEFVPIRATEKILPEYVFYFMLRNEFREVGAQIMTGAVGHKRVPETYFRELQIPLPPLDEQRRIIGVLDAAFEGLTRARTHTETNLNNARELFEVYLGAFFASELGGWSQGQLAELVSDDCTLSYGIVQPGDEVEKGLPIVRPTDLGPKVITAENLKRIDPKLASSYQRTKLQGGELLLCVRGSTGAVGVAGHDLAGSNVTRGIVPIRFNPALITEKLGYYLFKSLGVQEQIRNRTYGTALQQINIGDLRKIVLRFPSLSDQKGRVRDLVIAEHQCNTLQAHYRAKLADIDALRQSLLAKAFAGELT